MGKSMRPDLPTSRAEWQARADALSFRHQAFINGRWVDAFDGRRFDALSPIDGKVLTKVAECGSEDVDRAFSR